MADAADLWEAYTGPEFTGERRPPSILDQPVGGAPSVEGGPEILTGAPMTPWAFPARLRDIATASNLSRPAATIPSFAEMSPAVREEALRQIPLKGGGMTPAAQLDQALAPYLAAYLKEGAGKGVGFLAWLRNAVSKTPRQKPPAPRTGPQTPPGGLHAGESIPPMPTVIEGTIPPRLANEYDFVLRRWVKPAAPAGKQASKAAQQRSQTPYADLFKGDVPLDTGPF